MLLARIDSKKIDTSTLKKAVAILKHGGLVVYPTETAYALGCDPENAGAMKKLFSLKKRDASKPLPMIAASLSMARRFVKLDRYASMLANAFWPGPLTLVAPAMKEKKWLAVRVSPAPWAQALSLGLGTPIISTSANLSGHKTPYDAAAILRDLGAFPDVVLDAGVLKTVLPSTIVRAEGGVMQLLRQGAITEEDIHRELMKRL